MIVVHAQTAHLIGTPDMALNLLGGSISLDETRVPRAVANIRIGYPTLAVLAALDPRQDRRVRVVGTSTIAGTGITRTRTFDLSLRRRAVTHDTSGATLTLALASDEAILEDWAPGQDNYSAYYNQDSLRAITNYVLGKIGAALQPGTIDAPMRALIRAENLVNNPRTATNLVNWVGTGGTLGRLSTGGPPEAPTLGYVLADGTSIAMVTVTDVPVTAGESYQLSAWANVKVGHFINIDAVVRDRDGNLLYDVPQTTINARQGGVRTSVKFTAPRAAATADIRVWTSTTLESGEYLTVTAWRLSPLTADPTDFQYFDGDTADGLQYTYGWSGAGHESAAVRTPLIERSSDLLTWRAGMSGLAFLVPILQVLGLRLVCDELRRWTLRDASYTAPGSFAARHAVNIIRAEEDVNGEEDFDAAVTVYRWTAFDGSPQVRWDVYAPEGYTNLRLFERDSPYPGPGFSQHAVQRNRARTATVTTVTDWAADVEQSVTIDLAGSVTQLGKASTVDFDLDTDTMTISARTTDAPPAAWIFIPAGQRWNNAPAGTWTGEQING